MGEVEKVSRVCDGHSTVTSPDLARQLAFLKEIDRLKSIR